jgi:MEMO1 family protein
MDKPKIRPVEAFPIEHEGQTFVCLRDPTGTAPQPVIIGMGAYFLITLFDGSNTMLDVQAAFARRFGEILPGEKLRNLVETLDRAYFLYSPKFAERENEVREEFARSPKRMAALAGLCYEKDPDRLRAEIETWFEPPAGPGRASTAESDGEPVAGKPVPDKAVAGLISPHIDPRRGGPVYAHAYGELLGRTPPELVVILGTSHYGMGPELFTATCKDYATPLGTVATDRRFVERIAACYKGGDLFAQELLHRNEHSIEFQVLLLAWALGACACEVVPILVGSFHEMVADKTSPADNPRVAALIDALGNELASDRRRTLIIAGVDFAHVGRKFGDPFDVDEGVTDHVKREDLELIENIKRGDPAGFFAHVSRDNDQRRICGLSPMYTQLELLRGHAGRLLKYDITLEPQTGSAVSFAGLAID